ncbi:MAG TPA: ABC transporter substrate-binding protein [Dehalococcoidia bacterium]|nr:ABC transporter substrate-binding protein [Dehalococcoidia bacterium]
MSDSYWTRVVQGRVSRRRALVGTGSMAAAAAFLAACGGDGGGSSSSTTSDSKGSDLLAKIEDTSKNAKRGGIMKWTQASEPLHFDGQAQGQAQLNTYNGMAYESLVRNKPGVAEATKYNEVLANLAESWELSPDKTQITFKLRQGVKWQNIAPVSGRAFDSSDVIESAKRYEGHPTPNNSAANYNSKNPGAPIMSVSATDARTVVYKLKEPSSYIMQRFANMITGELGSIYPKEASGGFDTRQVQIGTGGYIKDKHEPSVSLTYKRNPDYWNKEAAWTDVLEIPFINQAPTREAQLKTGALYAVGGLADISPANIVQTKKDQPQLNLYSYIAPNNNVAHIQRFGWKPLDGKKPPWLDVRVRQAMAMAIDRDAYIDTFSNISNFNKEGLPAEPFYHTSMGYIPGVTLDPRSKDFGENAKYYTHNVAEAKKLLSAAGYANGFSYPSAWPNFPLFGPQFPQQMEVIMSFNREIGLKPESVPIDYNLKYLPDFVTKRGQHEGVVFTLGAVSSPDPVDFYVWRYYSKSGATSGAVFGDIGSGDGAGDPKVDELIEKAKAEFDAKKQGVILSDLQKYLAGMQYAISSPGLGTSFSLAWPCVQNYLTFQGDSRGAPNSVYYTMWVDDTKAPIKKA